MRRYLLDFAVVVLFGRDRRARVRLIALLALFVAVSAFAAHNQPSDTHWLPLVIGIFGGGTIVGLLMVGAQRREKNASADKLRADAVSASVDTIGDLLDQLTKRIADANALHETLSAAHGRIEHLEEQNCQFEQRIRELHEELASVQQIAAAALAANRIGDLEDVMDLFDLCDFWVWFTRSGDGGHAEWVNLATARDLKVRRADLLGTGWQAFLAPEDAEKTRRAEASAHRRRVWGFGNRFVSAEGDDIPRDWYAAAYKENRTIAFALTPRGEHLMADAPRTTRLNIVRPTP